MVRQIKTWLSIGVDSAQGNLFACVFFPYVYGRLSTDKPLSYGIRGIFITTLESRDTALAWLRVMEE